MARAKDRFCLLAWLFVASVAAPAWAQELNDGDINDDGYVNWLDTSFLYACFIYPTSSGPGHPTLQDECRNFDFDFDLDADLADFAVYQNLYGHLPIELKNAQGQPLGVDATEPYSPRQTCGGCHDLDAIGNGYHFQMGRTNAEGEVDMQPDWAGDGRAWNVSAGMYGEWGQSYKYMLAAKENTSASQIDQGSFAWVRDCGACHPGGGPGAFDRDGMVYFDPVTGLFGWEVAGRDPQFDGDYVDVDYETAALRQSPWDVTGVSEADCLLCHRSARLVTGEGDQDQTWVMRAGVFAAAEYLVDNEGASVPAFAAAATAGQGWVSTLELDEQPPVMQISYAAGVADGSLTQLADGTAALPTGFLTHHPKDHACVSCHLLDDLTGTVWFDQRDVHYRKFNRLTDEEPRNDVGPADSAVCSGCHSGGEAHNFAHGGSLQVTYRDEMDFEGFRTCRDCHLTEIAEGVPNPDKHPEAPDVPGDVAVHNVQGPTSSPMAVLSCQACHIPSMWARAKVFTDTTVDHDGYTDAYYSADPVDPTNEDRSTWYPTLAWRTDSDGVERLFPANAWVTIYFGDLNDGGTPDDLSDDIIAPIADWRIRQVISPTVLANVTDDTGDDAIEINREAEILACLTALRGEDSYGEPVAMNPVLVRGPRVWHVENGRIDSFLHAGTGIPVDTFAYRWGKNHNVAPADDAWGAGPLGCGDCHTAMGSLSPVFDRLILVDPYGVDGQPEYQTVRALTGISPP